MKGPAGQGGAESKGGAAYSGRTPPSRQDRVAHSHRILAAQVDRRADLLIDFLAPNPEARTALACIDRRLEPTLDRIAEEAER
jgi:hypothetical protein